MGNASSRKADNFLFFFLSNYFFCRNNVSYIIKFVRILVNGTVQKPTQEQNICPLSLQAALPSPKLTYTLVCAPLVEVV